MKMMNPLTLVTVTLSFSYCLLLVTVVISPSVVNANKERFVQLESSELTSTSASTSTITRVLAKGDKEEDCGEDEEYVTCNSGSCFDETCETLVMDPPRMCTFDCQTGCACVADYVRDETDGKCYPVSTCNDEDAKIAYQAEKGSAAPGTSAGYYGKNVGRMSSMLWVVLPVVLMKFAIL